MPINVLIIDDSAVIRRLLTRSLQSDPEIARVDSAGSGQIGLGILERRPPDVVILDVIMPEMDGLAVLREIRARDKMLPVIMFSTETRHAAQSTIEALSLGASAYVPKPSKLSVGPDVIERQLLPKIKALVKRRAAFTFGARPSPSSSAPRSPRTVPKASSPPSRRSRRIVRVQLLAIGASTGGPQALERVLTSLPGNLSVPVVVIQHMPPTFTMYLAQRLNSVCALRVREGIDGERLEPGDVWIAPGGVHMDLFRDGTSARIQLSDAPPENSCRPSVDVTFRAAARIYGSGVLAAVLTGMGSDGTKGSLSIAAAGGRIIAQDQASSVVWGMPRAVVDAGVADRVLPLGRIGPVLLDGVLCPRPGTKQEAS